MKYNTGIKRQTFWWQSIQKPQSNITPGWKKSLVVSFVHTIYPMCVYLYIYVCIYTVIEVKHFHKLISTALPTSSILCSPKPLLYIRHISYDRVAALGDWPWVTRQTQYLSTSVLSVCTYITICINLSWVFFHTHTLYTRHLYNTLFTCPSHRPSFFFHSFTFYFMTNL